MREYMLYTPTAPDAGTLTGYRRDADSAFVPWPVDEHGRLWSAVLDLHFAVQGPLLQAQTAAGNRLLTPAQSEDALYQAEAAHLRDELDRLRRSRSPGARQCRARLSVGRRRT